MLVYIADSRLCLFSFFLPICTSTSFPLLLFIFFIFSYFSSCLSSSRPPFLFFLVSLWFGLPSSLYT